MFVAEAFSWALGDLDAVERFGRPAVAASRSVGDQIILANSLAFLASIHQDVPQDGYLLLDEATRVAQESADPWTRGFVASCYALFAVLAHDGETARAKGEEGLEIFAAMRADRQVPVARLGLGFGLLESGEIDRARDVLVATFREFL